MFPPPAVNIGSEFIFLKIKFSLRVNGRDFYKVKWAGWPVESWTWVAAINCEHQPIDEFRRQLERTLPRSKWPKSGLRIL